MQELQPSSEGSLEQEGARREGEQSTLLFQLNCGLLKEVIERTWPLVCPARWTRAIGGSLSHSCPWDVGMRVPPTQQCMHISVSVLESLEMAEGNRMRWGGLSSILIISPEALFPGSSLPSTCEIQILLRVSVLKHFWTWISKSFFFKIVFKAISQVSMKEFASHEG